MEARGQNRRLWTHHSTGDQDPRTRCKRESDQGQKKEDKGQRTEDGLQELDDQELALS